MSVDDKKIIYSMIKVSKLYADKPILKDISLSYFYGAKIGVQSLTERPLSLQALALTTFPRNRNSIL